MKSLKKAAIAKKRKSFAEIVKEVQASMEAKSETPEPEAPAAGATPGRGSGGRRGRGRGSLLAAIKNDNSGGGLMAAIRGRRGGGPGRGDLMSAIAKQKAKK